MSEQYDLVIVGGGLGGAVLAKNMAERGVRVLVLEREKQFKDRVRGEFMTSWGVAEAKKLGIYELLCKGPAHQISWADFFLGTELMVHRDAVATTPHQLPCISFYHPAMQECLIAAAKSAGAHVRRGVTVQGVRPGATATVVVEQNGRTEEIGARLVVGADGRSSTARTSAGFKVLRDPEEWLIAGVLMDNVPAPADTATIVISPQLGQCAAVFPQGAGRARTYFIFRASDQPRYQGRGDLSRYIESSKNAGMNGSFYVGAKEAGPLATFDCAETWVERPYSESVALVGDAAAASDPSWGQGLGMTLCDVRVLRDHLLATEDWDAAGRAYAADHDRLSGAVHRSNQWYTQFYLEAGPQADARRARALPLIAADPSRQPDALFSGPEVPLDEAVRKRFFAED